MNQKYTLHQSQFNTSYTKAEKYIDTEKVQGSPTVFDDYLHYGIDKGKLLSLEHLLAIILYTDWSELCTNFTKTFRRHNYYQSIEFVRKENAEYAIWSRLLREVVEYWGCIGWNNAKDDEWNCEHNRVKGPFYCGMDFVMVVPEYNIRYI